MQIEEIEERKNDELFDAIERACDALTTLRDRVDAIERRSVALEALGERLSKVALAQEEHYRAMAEVLASHKVNIREMQKVLNRAAAAPSAPTRVVN